MVVELETVGKLHPTEQSTLGHTGRRQQLGVWIRSGTYLLSFIAVPVVDGQELDRVLLLTVAHHHQRDDDGGDDDDDKEAREKKNKKKKERKKERQTERKKDNTKKRKRKR